MHHNKTIAVLLSRQALAPTRRTPWVKALVSAAHWIKDQDCTLFTSVGMQTWELQLQLAVDLNIPQTIVIPADNESGYKHQCDFYRKQFTLQDSLTHFVHISRSCPEDNLLFQRDHYIVESADLLIPISIRKKGVMNKLLASAINKRIITRFSIPMCNQGAQLAQKYSDEKSNIDIDTVAEDYLFHWTRTSLKPWPSESLQNYYRDILEADIYPRNAFTTLDAILSSRLIIASSRHMPRGFKCVSFTGKSPSTFLPHMRWRSRYSEMSFEPYGIGLRKHSASIIGIKKVTYTNKTNISSEDDRWLYQSSGKIVEWQSEDEYRYLGNIDLLLLKNDDLLAICKTKPEADWISTKHGIQATYCFC